MEDCRSVFGEWPSFQPRVGTWPPPYVARPASRSRAQSVIAVAPTRGVALAAFVMALMRPPAQGRTKAVTAPTHPPTEASAAAGQCKLVARAVNGDKGRRARASTRTATTSAGAIMRDNAEKNASLETEPRNAARASAVAHETLTALGSNTFARDASYHAAPKSAAMMKVCSGG